MQSLEVTIGETASGLFYLADKICNCQWKELVSLSFYIWYTFFMGKI